MRPKVIMVPYEPRHAVDIVLRRHESGVRNLPEFEKWAEAAASLGPAWSAVGEDGTVYGCGGLKIMWPGVAESWILLFDGIEENGFRQEVYLQVVKLMIRVVNDFNLHRIQAHCKTDYPLNMKFLENMGFKREGIMRKFGFDKSDHYMYAWVRE